MSNQFSKTMSQRNDGELSLILTVNRHQYSDEALEAAQAEAGKRALNIQEVPLFTAEEASEKEEEKAFKSLKGLSKTNKILSLFFPILFGIVVALLMYLFRADRVAPFFGFIPVQIIIYLKLRIDDYKRMAAEFLKLSLYSYLILIGLVIFLFFLSSYLGGH